VADRKAFLLRVDPAVLEAVQSWANDELRSLNGQIEYLLRQALRQAGRIKTKGGPPGSANADPAGSERRQER
jgi:hypothetical protein